MFAGNLGEAQSLNTLIEAAKIVHNKGVDVKWVFLGDGRMRENLELEIKNNRLVSQVFLLGSYPSKDMPYFFSCSDALIVSLKDENIFSLTIPSKVQSYMACEKPILASLNGEGAKIVEMSNCGFVSPAEDAKALADNVLNLYGLHEKERGIMGRNAGDYFRKEFERDVLLDRLIGIINE
jgi:glycosyltransferase involved in cell wall biosynthesis